MRTKDEKLFDSAIFNKLSNEELEVPDYIWENIKKENKWNSLFGWIQSLRGFLFQDVILLLVFSSSLLSTPEFLLSSNSSIAAMFSEQKTINDKYQFVNNTNISSSLKILSERTIISEQPHTTKFESGTSVYLSSKDKVSLKKSSVYNKNNSSDNSLVNETFNLDKEDNSNVVITSTSDNISRREFIFVSAEESAIAEVQEMIAGNKFRSAYGFRMAAGINSFSGKFDNNDRVIVTDNNSRSAIGPAFQLLFEFPINKNWNVLAGIGQNKRSYNWTEVMFSSMNTQLIDSTTGYIISPFEPPVLYTIYDTSAVEVELQNMTNTNFVLITQSFYVLGEYVFHYKKMDARLNAGLRLNFRNKISNESEESESGELETGTISALQLKPGFDAIAGGEISLNSNGLLQPYLRVEATSTIANDYKKLTGNIYNEKSLSVLVGLRVLLVK